MNLIAALISYRNPHDQASVRHRSTCHIAPPLLSRVYLQNEAYCWFSLRLPTIVVAV